jgi:DNA-binding beta-propeller fold protein YncE
MDLDIQDSESFIMGLAFDNDTQTFWVANNFNNNLMNVDMNGQTLSTVNFSPDSAPEGYQISGLAFDDVNNTLWVNYADFMSGPSNGIIYEVSMGSVVPEPISSVLFVTGGAALGLRRWKYFKKTG